MSIYIKITLFVLVVSLLIVILAIFIKIDPGFKKLLKQGEQVQSQSSDNIALPIDINNQSVTIATINYGIEGTIEKLINTSEGTEMKLKPEIEGAPKILLNDTTQYFYFDGVRSTLANKSELRPGQKVRILMLYGLKVKKWSLSRVNIIVPDVRLNEQTTNEAPSNQ